MLQCSCRQELWRLKLSCVCVYRTWTACPGAESDLTLLAWAVTWPFFIPTLRRVDFCDVLPLKSLKEKFSSGLYIPNVPCASCAFIRYTTQQWLFSFFHTSFFKCLNTAVNFIAFTVFRARILKIGFGKAVPFCDHVPARVVCCKKLCYISIISFSFCMPVNSGKVCDRLECHFTRQAAAFVMPSGSIGWTGNSVKLAFLCSLAARNIVVNKSLKQMVQVVNSGFFHSKHM